MSHQHISPIQNAAVLVTYVKIQGCPDDSSHEFHETGHSITSQCTGQFTLKMKANVKQHLLSSLV